MKRRALSGVRRFFASAMMSAVATMTITYACPLCRRVLERVEVPVDVGDVGLRVIGGCLIPTGLICPEHGDIRDLHVTERI